MNALVIKNLDTKEIVLPILGCALLMIGASIKIPFYPVPLTLHTFALYFIALTQSPKQALYSACLYLAFRSLGFPLTNPFWWMGQCGGYLWAFPIAAFGIASLKSKIGNIFSLLLGSSLILLCGFMWLIPFAGLKLAWTQGLLVFIPCELLKILIVLAIKRRLA